MFVLLKPSYITGRYMGRGREGRVPCSSFSSLPTLLVGTWGGGGRGGEGTMFVLLKPSYITGRYMGRGGGGEGRGRGREPTSLCGKCALCHLMYK